MSTRQRTALALFALGTIALCIFPPFFAMDPNSEGRIHGPLGFHPVWAAPDEAYALEVLTENGVVPAEDLDTTSLEIHRNNVLFVFCLFLLLAGVSVAGFFLRTRDGEEGGP